MASGQSLTDLKCKHIGNKKFYKGKQKIDVSHCNPLRLGKFLMKASPSMLSNSRLLILPVYTQKLSTKYELRLHASIWLLVTVN